MIDVVELYQFVSQTRRSGSSGYDSDTEFNINLKAVDTDVYRTLIPFYSKDDRIQKLFSPFIERLPISLVNGAVDFPDNFTKYIDTEFSDGSKIVYPRNINEKARIKSSPIDSPTIDSPEYYCFFGKENISYLPDTLTDGVLIYVRKSIPGEISFEMVEDDNADYFNVVKVRDIEWPEEMFGLFSALMLEKYGFQNRESVALEYANLGVQREIVNTTR